LASLTLTVQLLGKTSPAAHTGLTKFQY